MFSIWKLFRFDSKFASIVVVVVALRFDVSVALMEFEGFGRAFEEFPREELNSLSVQKAEEHAERLLAGRQTDYVNPTMVGKLFKHCCRTVGQPKHSQ